MMLLRKGLLEFIDFFYSNQDVKNPKPNTEMYLKCMIKAGVDPKDCVIVEDSHIGRKAAIKSGAIDYLPKPAEVEQIYDALTSSKNILPQPHQNPMTQDRVRWEHIQRVFIQCNRNVSETARRLRMHRRTLQRILNKHAPRE